MTKTRSSKGEAVEDPYFGEHDAAEPVVKRPPGKGWPDEVPVLLSGDLTWNFTTGDDRFDLAFWLANTFDRDEFETPHQNAVYDILLGVISERSKKHQYSLWAFLEEACKRKSPGLGWQA